MIFDGYAEEEEFIPPRLQGVTQVTRRGLETDRLQLRPWSEEDLADYVTLLSDPRVTRYMLPMTAERIEGFVAGFLRMWEEDGFGPFAALDRATGDWIGQIGLNRVAGWPDADNVEVGFELDPAWWVRGLATEGALACIRLGFEERGLDRIIGVTNPDNAASRRALEKAGLVYQGLRAYPPGLESAWYRIDRIQPRR